MNKINSEGTTSLSPCSVIASILIPKLEDIKQVTIYISLELIQRIQIILEENGEYWKHKYTLNFIQWHIDRRLPMNDWKLSVSNDDTVFSIYHRVS